MVSRYLEQMEKWAGTRLVNRSTRKLTLTAAGEKVLQNADALADPQEIEGQSEKISCLAPCGWPARTLPPCT